MIAIIEFMVAKFGIPLLMEYMKRREESPEFSRAADTVFANWNSGSTTGERRKALKDMHALLKG